MNTDVLISPDLVEAFMQGHYGYGNLAAPFWLIGMEEGGGGSVEEVALRMDTWKALGGTVTSDLAEHHRRLGMPELFEDPVKLQHTWARLIRLLLAAQGQPANSSTIKAYQRDHLGRSQDDTCLLELLPLPLTQHRGVAVRGLDRPTRTAAAERLPRGVCSLACQPAAAADQNLLPARGGILRYQLPALL